ncbi:MAG TPA: T9SS type B sorting domain-containing protein, partial [Flavobacteriales bacterium]|nr:T9SS type B sorting domain-containing protein [Flavobacteriales bacterium]
VSMPGGISPFTYLWSDPSAQTTSTAIGLCAGNYSVTVTDTIGCTSIVDTVLVEPIQISLLGFETMTSCKGVCNGSIIVTPEGTLTPYTFQWDSLSGYQTNDTASALCAGNYSVTVSDGNGCVDSFTYTVLQDPSSPIAGFDFLEDTVSLIESIIEFTNTSLPYIDSLIFIWDFGDGGIDSVIHPTHNYLDTGSFTIQLIVKDSTGCVDTIFRVIVVEDEYILFAPNAFTPNGDGYNDYFFPKGVGLNNSIFKMYIYNRWGDEIFESSDVMQYWDGRANGGTDVAQEDVYVWLIETYDMEFQQSHRYVGHVTLIK